MAQRQMRPYPDGIEFIWLVSDCRGQVGMFVSAGCGLIPWSALMETQPDCGLIYELFKALPKIGEAIPDGKDKCDADIEAGGQGFFVFDWTDVRCGPYLDQYERTVAPSRPIRLYDLPAELAGMAGALQIGADFKDVHGFDPQLYFECAGPTWFHVRPK